MKNEDLFRKEIFELLKDEVISETENSNTKELFKKLIMTLGDEIDNDDLIEDILSDE